MAVSPEHIRLAPQEQLIRVWLTDHLPHELTSAWCPTQSRRLCLPVISPPWIIYVPIIGHHPYAIHLPVTHLSTICQYLVYLMSIDHAITNLLILIKCRCEMLGSHLCFGEPAAWTGGAATERVVTLPKLLRVSVLNCPHGVSGGTSVRTTPP